MVKLMRQALAQARKDARRNRLWMVVVKGDNLLLVSPAYYLQHDPEADQCRRFEKPLNAGLRLADAFFKGVNTEIVYLGRYILEAPVSYRHLHVCLAFVSQDDSLPLHLRDFMQPLGNTSGETQNQVTVTQHVVEDIKQILDRRPQSIMDELQKLLLPR